MDSPSTISSMRPLFHRPRPSQISISTFSHTPLIRRQPTRSSTWFSELTTFFTSSWEYPNPNLPPRFGRRQASLIAISGVIGTGLFLGSGQALADAGPLGLLLGYMFMASVVYGMVVSTSEMVAVYPYCHGTVGLANRFVDPALGFAMGWNAWYHWGIVIPSQIAAATALINYWNPPGYLASTWPFIFIILTSGTVLGSRIYGEVESVFALIKIAAVIMLVILTMILDVQNDTQKSLEPFRFWRRPFEQYLDIPGGWGRLLGFWAVFIQAAVAFFGTEIPSIIAGEVIDAPRVLPEISRRVWLRVTILYTVAVFAAGTLVSPDILAAKLTDPSNPNSPSDDAPWRGSPFLVALYLAGRRYNWVTNLFIAMFITSAASAASTEVFIASRYLYFLAEAGHAPAIFKRIYPDTPRAREEGAVVPIWGVGMTVGFATLSFMSMRPRTNSPSEVEKVFKWIFSMTTAACLQAWIGTLFTYLRFWRGTRCPANKTKYMQEIARIKQVRAWGQPFWAIYSFTICCLILIFNGWTLFNSKNGKWVIYHTETDSSGVPFVRDQVIKFFTSYVPLPILLLLIFWYKLIKQTRMKRAHEMDFSGVAYPDPGGRVEPVPEGWGWRRIWWTLVY